MLFLASSGSDSTNGKERRELPSPEAPGWHRMPRHRIAALPANRGGGHRGNRWAARIASAAKQTAIAIELDREHVAFGPRRAKLDLVTTSRELRADFFIDALLDTQNAGTRVVRIEGRGEMRAGKFRRLDRLLQGHPEIDDVEKKLQRPLILLIATRSSEREIRLIAAHRERRR